MDIIDERDHLLVVGPLPCLEERDMSTEVKGMTPTITATREGGMYSKQVNLPVAVTGELTTTYKKGMLKVKLKKAKAVT